MLYKISNVVIKSPDWKIVDGMGVDGTPLLQASVNRTDKKGEVFPKFDDIIENSSIEGEPWQNDTGKQYLFAPRAPRASGGGKGSFAIKEAQDTKRTDILNAQSNKEEAIKTASTFSAATALTVAMMAEDKLIDWHITWTENRKWLLAHWEPEAF